MCGSTSKATMYQYQDELQQVSNELLCLGVKWEAERKSYLIHSKGVREPSRAGVMGTLISIPLYLGFCYFVANNSSKPIPAGIGAAFLIVVPGFALYRACWEAYQLRRFEAAKAHYEAECLRLQQKLDGMDGSWQP